MIDDNICISHVRKNRDGEIEDIQTNQDHSLGVADLACRFAGEFGMGNWGKALGRLHDKGKERKAFQNYIRHNSGCGSGNYCIEEHNHAFVGGLLAKMLYGKGSESLLCNQIVSHHSGLHDYCDLETILCKDLPEEIDISVKKDQLDRPPFTFKPMPNQKGMTSDANHLSRMLYSCLVDADYLDTELFMDRESAKTRRNDIMLEDLLPLFEEHIEHLQRVSPKSEVNSIRKEVHKRCTIMSDTDKGFYSLTVPTGGGKTLSSLVWAMRHAIRNGMKRIIIAIPYTSIIVQTASILKKIFGEKAVLEHHSNFDSQSIKDATVRLKAELATENWDYPIIVTTNVQLFESMFSNKPSDCRKLHNIVNSVIILDEVQTLPTDFLQPIVDALKSYQNMFGVSVLFTTASQPLLSGIIEGCNPRAHFSGIDNIIEIIPQDYCLHDKLRRVCLKIDEEGSTYDDIAERLCRHNRVLCIVNTRNDAREIFERLPKEGLTVHLSRMMCPKHLSEKIATIKQALSDNTEKKIRVVATQLIEAGVDIDFPVVYRQEAGLDSILQAAGRCNREGKLEIADTYVFSLSKEHILYGNIKDANNARLNMADIDDWFAPGVMTEYFRQFYCRKETFDKKGIKNLLYKPSEMCFKEASEKFRLIEDVGKTVIVNMDDSMELIERLKTFGITYSLMKQLSQYSVNIYEKDFNALKSYGAIEEVIEGIYVVNDRAQYDENIGLRLDNHWMNEIIMA
ncbi:MAG: CRISPR-associated helicase Cas3' [Candidatus Cryptobacteroides sp.]